MKKKGISVLLVMMLMLGSTSMSFASNHQLSDLQNSINYVCKVWNTYIYKCLQNNNQQQNKPQIPDSDAGDNIQSGTNNGGSQTGNDNQGGGGNQNTGTNDDTQGGAQGGISQSSKASEILSLVNKERSAAGLSGLKADSSLNMLAQLKAEDMAKNKYFSHNSPTYGSAFDMMKQYGFSYRTAGENIAKGQKSSQTVMNAWMNSSGHRANILGSSYTKLGVGYAVDAGGNTYWVQMFAG